MNLSPELMNWIAVASAIVTVLAFVVSFYFFHKTKITAKDLEIEKKRYDDLRQNLHWQLQALHHACNRLENIVHDPRRSPEAINELARAIKDSVDALMGQTLGRIHLFPWNNYPIVDPESGQEIGRMIENRQWYKDDWTAVFFHRFGGSWKAAEARTDSVTSENQNPSSENPPTGEASSATKPNPGP